MTGLHKFSFEVKCCFQCLCILMKRKNRNEYCNQFYLNTCLMHLLEIKKRILILFLSGLLRVKLILKSFTYIEKVFKGPEEEGTSQLKRVRIRDCST